MTEQSETRLDRIRKRIALALLPASEEELIEDLRRLEYYQYHPFEATGDCESDRSLRGLHEKLGLDQTVKPEPYRVVQDDLPVDIRVPEDDKETIEERFEERKDD